MSVWLQTKEKTYESGKYVSVITIFLNAIGNTIELQILRSVIDRLPVITDPGVSIWKCALEADIYIEVLYCDLSETLDGFGLLPHTDLATGTDRIPEMCFNWPNFV